MVPVGGVVVCSFSVVMRDLDLWDDLVVQWVVLVRAVQQRDRNRRGLFRPENNRNRLPKNCQDVTHNR